jgi:DedD protein
MNQQLKQRLVGAVVLVSLAVIFIPIILEGPDDEWSPRTQGMPEPPQIAYHGEDEAELPLSFEEAPAAGIPASGSIVPEPVVQAAAEPEPAPEPPAPAVAAVPAPQAPATAPTPVKKAPPAPATTGGWAIQVGRFSQQLNAQGLRDRLRKSGYASFLQESGSGREKSWQVLVGPLKSRSDAEKIRDELASRRQLKGFVVQNNG